MRDAVHDPTGYLAHKLWRIIFVPIAMLALSIARGIKGFLTFVSFALIVIAVGFMKLPR